MANIMWRDQDKKEIQRVVNNFNAKIRYWEKQGVEGLPEKVKMSDVKELITTRQDFNRELNRLKRFGKKGSEKTVELETGLKISKWEKKELSIAKSVVNRKRSKLQDQIKELDAKSRGKKLGLKRGEMGSARVNAYNPRKFDINKIRNRKELDKLMKSLRFEMSDDWEAWKIRRLKQGYLKSLKSVFGGAADMLIEHITGLSESQFLNTYMSDQQADIGFLYGVDDAITKYEILLTVWDFPEEDVFDELDNFETILNNELDAMAGFGEMQFM